MQPYTHSAAFDEGYLEVSELHKIYYAQYGKKGGKPVIFLHGGPGGGAAPTETRFFDPDVYHVVLMDQRGSGRSLPVAEVRENTTQHLVADIETLRKKVGVEKWHLVFGGSWGSSLSLAYAQSHPEAVGSMIIRGIFLCEKWELEWTLEGHGTAVLYPEEWQNFLKHLPEEQRKDPVQAYAKLLLETEDKQQMIAAARAWNTWEMSVSFLGGATTSLMEKLNDDNWSLQHARLEAHYFTNACFLAGDKALMHPDNIAKIVDIPTYIVQGRYDIVCPPKAAWTLHKVLPKSELHWSQHAGHSATEPGTQAKLIELCDKVGAA